MTREEALEISRVLGEAVNAHDAERLTAMYAPNAVIKSPMWQEVSGAEAIGETWRRTFALFPDWTVSATDVFVEGNRIALLGAVTATDRNGWFGQPPTGERLEYRATIVLTLLGGKIVRDERMYDLSSVLQRLEKTRVDKELAMAAEVQRTLTSGSCRSTAYCEAVGNSIACRAIGGDFFELSPTRTGEFVLAIGDVSGKGPASALLAAMIQGMLGVEIENGAGPAAMLTRINELLFRRKFEARFATLCCAVLAPDGTLEYSNAGHNPPLLISGESVRRLQCGGCVLGSFPESTFEQERLRLADGDTLVMFSDGLTETPDRNGEEFGEERLVNSVKANRERAPAEILGKVMEEVDRFRDGTVLADDVTLTIARFRNNLA